MGRTKWCQGQEVRNNLSTHGRTPDGTRSPVVSPKGTRLQELFNEIENRFDTS